MSEKDILREMLQNTLKNETAPVRPELWQGVQAKMAAAGVASTTSTIAVKGFSALTKWLAGSAAVATLSVGTYFMLPKEETKKIVELKPAVVELKEVLPVATIKEEIKENKNDYSISFDIGKLTSTRPDCGTILWGWGSASCTGPTSTNLVVKLSNLDSIPTPNVYSNNETINNHGLHDVKNNVQPTFIETPEPIASVLESKVTEFPNVFTPNGDGQNDTYFVKVQNINAFEMKIFNSLNQVVFVTNNSEESWNGQFNNENVPVGMYFVLVTGKDASGKSISDKQLIEVRR